MSVNHNTNQPPEPTRAALRAWLRTPIPKRQTTQPMAADDHDLDQLPARTAERRHERSAE